MRSASSTLLVVGPVALPISLTAGGATIAAVVLSGLLAAFEGNFILPLNRGLGFANHGGMWSDLILLPIVNAVITPWIGARKLPRPLVLFAMSCAIAMSVIVAHSHWLSTARERNTLGFMFVAASAAPWYRSLSVAGWMHVGFMSTECLLLSLYVISAVPRQVAVCVGVLMTLHVPLAILQPGWYESARSWTSETIVPAFTVLFLVATVTAVKLRGARPLS